MTTPTELLRQTNRLNDLADEGQDLGYSSLADELREISQAISAHLERSGEVQEPAVPPGYVLVPIEPTQEMITAMSASKAKDSEGEFPMLLDLIDYSGENKTHAVLKAAYVAMLAAVPTPKEPI